MPNDDLGTFPSPPLAPQSPQDDAGPTPPVVEPIIPEVPVSPIPVAPPVIPDSVFSPEPPAPPFEETPDTIPSAVSPPPPPQPVEVPATLPPKSDKTAVPIIIIVLLIIAGIGLAAAAFLSSQTNKLKAQLSEITQTLEKQQTTLTPTVTPTVFEIPTPTTASQSGRVTPPTQPTSPQTLDGLYPLKNASSALQIAINHSPNAQLILIKVDNATSAETAVTKYFFREDLSTKKYFYVSVAGKGSPEIIDKQIYVTPDDNIPSLNDSVLGNMLGLDLDEVIRMSYTQCANQEACITAPIKAQYIKTGSGIIWQLSLYTNGLTGTPLMIQINAETKAILYKSPEFGNK